MKIGSKKEIKISLLLTAAFLLGGVIHVVIDPWDFTSTIIQIYYSSLVLTWAVTINYRITDRKVRRLMLLTVALLMLNFFLQMCRYRIFEHSDTAKRYFWYGYYIPINLVPVLFLFVVLRLNLQEDEKINWRWHLVLIPAVTFILLVLTNDLHQLIFRFITSDDGKYGTYTHPPLYFILYGWITVIMGLALVLAIRKCRIPTVGKKLWMPLYFASYGILVLCTLFNQPKIGDVTIWLLVECVAMVAIGMEESCIQLGLIPANSGYRSIFRLTNKPVIIADEDGKSIYTSAVAREMFGKQDNVRIHTESIRGGSVSWAVDLSRIAVLNGEIENATEAIASRNDYLRTENALKEEQSKLSARNALYTRIAQIVRPQLEAVQTLIRESDSDKNLAKIVVLTTYIKRRSNMELLRADQQHFPAQELATAIRESCEHLKHCGVQAMVHTVPDCELSGDTQVHLYEAFEGVLEHSLDSLQFLLVNLVRQNGNVVLRLTLRASGLDVEALRRGIPEGLGFYADAESDEAAISVLAKEGGAGE